MSIPPHLAGKLNEVVGLRASEELVSWMDDTRSSHAEVRADIAELRQEMRVALTEQSGRMTAQSTELKGQMAALSAELKALMAAQSAELKAQMAALGAQMTEQMAKLATDLRAEIHVVDNKIEKRFSDLLLWSFVFWTSAVAAIALLAGVLRS